MTPTPAPTPHIQTETSRYTQASKKNSTHPLTTNATSPNSQLDASGTPHPLQRHHRHLRQVPNSSVRESGVEKRQRHKEKLKLAGLDEGDGSALTQSGDEVEKSSPPPHDQSIPGTEAGTEVGENVEMAERSSPSELSFHTATIWIN